MNSSQGYVASGNSRLYWESAGDGEALVLIHGNMVDRRMWDFNFPALAQHHRVVRYDMRGFGQSGTKGSELGAAVEDLKLLLSKLSISSTAVCGASMGGVVATHFALTEPQRTKGVVLVGTDMSGFPMSAEFADPILRTYKVLEQADTAAARAIWLEHPMLAGAKRCKRAYDLLEKMFEEYTWEDWLSGRGYLVDPPALTRLSEITAPMLIVTGEYEMARFTAIARLLEQEVQDSRWVVIPGTGHLPNMEDANTFNSKVLDFLKRLGDHGADDSV